MVFFFSIDEHNHVLDLKRLRLWDNIRRVRSLMIYHIESLMYNYNNNAAKL